MTRLLPRMPVRTESGVEEFPCGPRGVETRMVRQMLPFALVIAPVAMIVSWAVGGPDALLSAAFGVGLALGNLALSAVIMERCARVGGQALMFGALGGFVGRMMLLTLVVFGLEQFAVVPVAPLVVVLALTFVGLIVAESFVVMASDHASDHTRALKATERNAP